MYRVLIIEDSKSISTNLKNLIEEDLGLKVSVANTLKESASLLLKFKGKFDVILTDLGLPDAPNGEIVDFVTKFSIPVVVLTGKEELENENKFRNKNIVDYIIKDGLFSLNYATSIVQRIIKNKTIKVLVVDDSKTFLTQVKELLLRYKLNVLTALNGEEALSILKENQDIKIVLTDYMMPKMDGLELTKEIRKAYHKDELSIIVTSSDSSRKIPAKFLKYGANDFIYKGFSDEEFFVRVNSNLEILEMFEDAKNKANKDFMTGMYNRRYLFVEGKQRYENCKRNDDFFATVIIDIDKFKNINDSYGHDIGDIAIKEVARILNKNIDKDCLISRLGGEEFCILIWNRDKSSVNLLLENIRKEFELNKIALEDSYLSYTVSMGCTFDYKESLDAMIQESDNALYDAKNSGRNKVIIK